MRTPLQNSSEKYHRTGIGLLAMSILAGRIELSRMLPVGGRIGEVEIANILLSLAFFLALALAATRESRPRPDPRALGLLAALAVFLMAVPTIDLLAGRSVDVPLAEELCRLLATGIALVLMANTAPRLRFFLAALVVIGLCITLGDLAGWWWRRLQLITGLSTSRINLLVVGASATLFLQSRRSVWLVAFALAIFALMSGSMKIAMLASVIALAVLAVVLLSRARFADTARFLLAAGVGVLLSALSGDIDHAITRFEAMNVPQLPRMANVFEKPSSTSEAIESCKGTQNPTYCASPFFLMGDRTERLRLFSHAITLIKAAPLLGPGRDAYDLELYYSAGGQSSLNSYKYPHNLFLNIGVSHGLAGIAVLCGFLFLCLVVTLSTFSAGLTAAGYLIVGISVFAAAQTGGDFYDARYIFLAALLAALGARHEPGLDRARPGIDPVRAG